MQQLNTEGYSVGTDNLIAGNSQHISGRVVEIAVSAGTVTKIKRGQVIDVANGVYALHAKSGTPAAIVATTIAVEASETKVPVEVYESGEFNEMALISAEAITAADKETLREKNIILK